MEHRGQQSRRTTERRILVALLCDRASARIRDASQRQLPTDHDYDGRLSLIREYQSDQPSRNSPRQLTRVLQNPRNLGPPSLCTCGVVPYQEPVAHRRTERGGAQPGRMQGAAKRRILAVCKRAATPQTARLRPPRDAWRLCATGPWCSGQIRQREDERALHRRCSEPRLETIRRKYGLPIEPNAITPLVKTNKIAYLNKGNTALVGIAEPQYVEYRIMWSGVVATTTGSDGGGRGNVAPRLDIIRGWQGRRAKPRPA